MQVKDKATKVDNSSPYSSDSDCTVVTIKEHTVVVKTTKNSHTHGLFTYIKDPSNPKEVIDAVRKCMSSLHILITKEC